MKYLLIIGDGMADDPVPALGHKTPLEAAKKPAIDQLCRRGQLGSVVNCPKEFELADGDMACRCNMVTLEDADKPYEQRRILSHSAGSIDGETADELITQLWASPEFAALAKEYDIEINPGSSFRHFAVMHHADIAGISLIPPHDHLGEVIGPLAPSGCAAAEKLEKLQEAAFRFLDQHPLNTIRRAAGKLPANGIWFWAEGTAALLPDFVQKYGHTGEVVSAVPLVRGIARLSGLEAPLVEGVTGEIDTNWDGKCQKTIEILSRCDFAALHIEAPDECTHNGDTPGKIQSIEWLSSRETEPILEWLRGCGEDFRILLLSDHKTLTANRAHGGDPVPFLLYDSREQTCSGLPYTEKNGLATGLFLPEGTALLDMLFEK